VQPEPGSTTDLEPAKTRGFLFADLRGYTQVADAQGDQAAADLLARFRPIVRAAVGRTGGAEIRTEGDSFFVVFDSVSAAVRCGLEIIAGAASPGAGVARIDVGVGVHAGEALPTGEGLVGVPINIAARLCALAGPGELLVSDTVRALTRTYLGVGFEALGSRRLKGVQEQVSVYRVLPIPTTGDGRASGRAFGAGRRVWVAAGLAGIAVVGLAALAFAVSRGAWQGGGAGPSGSTSALTSPSPAVTRAPAGTTTASASPAASASAALGTASSDPFPNAAETALLATMRLLPPSLTVACVRGTYAVLNGYDGRSIPLASVACRPQGGSGASTLLIRRFGAYRESGGPADYGVSVIGNIAAGKSARSDDILPGDCAISPRAEGRWEIPSVASGSLICYPEADTGDAVLWWTYDGANLIVRITSQRGDGSGLYTFFDRYKGMISP